MAKALAKDGYAITTRSFSQQGVYIVSVEHMNASREKDQSQL